MLVIGQSYRAIDANSIPHTVHVIKKLGAGQIVDVFEVQVSGTTHNGTFAAKIAREDRHIDNVYDEYDILKNIEDRFVEFTNRNDIPIPTGNFLLGAPESDEPDLVPALLLCMEVLKQPELFDVFRNLQATAGDDLGHILRNEIMVWKAALDYLALQHLLLNKLGENSPDRKRDTFLWDEGKQKLLVVDWNVINKTSDNTPAETQKAIKLFADNWFTLLTRQLPTSRIPTFDDQKWGNASLFARDLLSDLRGQSAWILKPTDRADLPKLIEKIESYFNLIRKENLETTQQQFKTHEIKWRNDADKDRLSPDELMKRYRFTLYYADVLRRRLPDNPIYQNLYDTIINATQVQGEPVDQRNIRGELTKLARNQLAGIPPYIEIVRDSLQKLQDDRANAPRYQHIVFRLIEELRTARLTTDESNQEKSEVLRFTLENLKERKGNVDDLYTDLIKQVAYYTELVDGLQHIKNGEVDAAIPKFESVNTLLNDPQIQELTTHLGLPSNDVHVLYSQIKASVSQTGVCGIRDDFIQYALENNLEAFCTRYEQISIRLTPFENDVRIQYDTYSRYLLLADEMVYGLRDFDLKLMSELLYLSMTFPELRTAIMKTQFIKSAYDHYLELRRIISDDLKKHEYDSYLYEQAFDLASVLRQFKRLEGN